MALLDVRQRLRDRRQRFLLELARGGHERAFRRLYRELYGPVARYVSARVRPREDAEDVTSQIFFKLLRGLDRYDPERGSPWTWIMTLARNTVIDHLRSTRPTASAEELSEVLVGNDPDPLSNLIEEEEARFAHGVLRRYPAEVREMFSLRFAHGFRYREIAEVMNLSEAAVKQRFSRISRELRLEIEKRRRGGEENATQGA
jgi:RNA polymerase sigma-70 factor (ECF subfamily)